MCFQWFGAPEGRKETSLKRRVRSAAGQMRDEKLHAVMARSTFPSQNGQSTTFSDHFGKLRCRKSARHCGAKHFQVKTHVRTTFGSWDVEKVHAVAARSTCPSQNVQNTPCSDHFWKLKCRKSARCCGAKHISKSKCTKHTRLRPLLEVEMSKKCTLLWRKAHFQVKMYKHTMLRPLLEVEMSKKCTPLWREEHFQVKMYKAHHAQTTFGSWNVEKVHAVVARSTFPSQNVQNTPGCRKSARRCGAKHISKSKVSKTEGVSGHVLTFRCRPPPPPPHHHHHHHHNNNNNNNYNYNYNNNNNYYYNYYNYYNNNNYYHHHHHYYYYYYYYNYSNYNYNNCNNCNNYNNYNNYSYTTTTTTTTTSPQLQLQLQLRYNCTTLH